MTQSRFYSSAAQPATLAAGCTAGAASISVSLITGWPGSYPFTLLLDWGSFITGAFQEAVSVTSAPTGTGPYTVPVTRGIDGTAASAHSPGAVVVHGVSAQDYNDPALHVNGFTAGMAPSGLTGATAVTRYVGGTTSGAPASGTFAVGDFVIDRTGFIWVCTVAGTPGTWVQAGSSVDTTASDIQPSPGTRAAGSTTKAADAGHVHGQPPMLALTGLTGATAASRFVGATASGAPASGTFITGDFVLDQSGTAWVCTAGGTPGTWTQIVGGSGSIPGGAAGGDLTGSYPSPTVGTNKITNAKAAQMAALTVKGNQTSATANPTDMTAAQAMSILGGLAYALANGIVMP